MSKQNMADADALTDSAFYILMALLVPRHGYLIMQYVKEISEGQFVIGPATLYTMIKKLVKEEWIMLVDEVDRKKIYQITTSGEKMWQQDVARRERMVNHAKLAKGLISDGKK